jgi:hypothetical protein
MSSELVTFVAGPPRKTDKDDLSLQALATAARKGGEVVRVPRLVDIAAYLQQHHNDPPKTIQIAGHARPGMIALGYFWNEQVRNGGFHQLLDSSPYAYGELWSHIQPGMRVVLAGCLVGADVPQPTIAGGSTLIFDLHKMWECDVFAADAMVTSEHFVDGYYVGSAYGHTRDGWCHIQGITHFDPEPKPGDRPKFTDVQITDAPMLGSIGSKLEIAVPGLLDDYSEELQLLVRPLALDEVRFIGKLDDVPATFSLLAGGRLLEATVARSKRRFFRPPRVAKDHVAQARGTRLWNLIRDAVRMRPVAR